MTWYQVLGLGVLGGVIVGSVFYVLGTILDHRAHRRWERETNLVLQGARKCGCFQQHDANGGLVIDDVCDDHRLEREMDEMRDESGS